MAVKLNLDEIINRKTDLTKKSNESIVNRSSDKIKKTEIINIPIYEQDNKLIQAFKTLVNEQKTTIQDMENSGFFRETEAYNIIYNLKKPYENKKDPKNEGAFKMQTPQFSWLRAEKLLNYFGYDVEFVFHKLDK